jgi:5-formyltetrahydrofolate cyclo-ligase
MRKKDVRAHFIKVRNELFAEELDALSRDAADCFFNNIDLTNVKCIHIFLPIALKSELNTKYIIDRLWREYPEIDVSIPKSDLVHHTIESYYFTPQTVLEDNPWKIPEPVHADPTPHERIDLVVVPLLAFDRRGYRVGYGKGFYDKFLATCRKDVLRIGLSCFPPIDHIEDVEPFDIPMDCCIVGKDLYTF